MKQLDIVMIRLDALGDFVLWLESARIIRSHLKDRRLTLLARSDWASLARATGYFDEVIPISTHLYVGRWRLLRQLIKDFFRFRRWRAREVVHPVHSRTVQAELIARWIQSDRKIAPIGDLNNLQSRINRFPAFRYAHLKKTYTWLIDTKQTGETTELALNTTFVSEYLGGIQYPVELIDLRLVIPAQSIDLPPNYVVVVPGAGDCGRAWPLENFVSVLNRTPLPGPVVVCGSSSEEHLTTGLSNALSLNGIGSINLGGKTSILELLAVISKAKWVLANDSAAAHMAAAFRVPTIAITGGGHPGRFLPYRDNKNRLAYSPIVVHKSLPCYGCNWACDRPRINGSFACIGSVTVTDVRYGILSIRV